ncbi:hypothetical protein D9758_006234 [Tetrapyrgos nigripes]|uniref:NodB homology domain-containing protein n=1 Tax=Tetrapyrgos nigripes TaxID=182062 RepID=A0A8H5GAL7_9AGAR|nr:hypothetical protein D9758_006234 [Tetrapyrgos nigripes]
MLLDTKTGVPPSQTDVSRGVFGATIGLERVLKLFDKYGIKATFFVPGHTLESFPEDVAKIRDKGHEIGLHGYTHEHAHTLTLKQERDVLAKSIEVITTFTGKKPKGWTGPLWETSTNTVRLLEEFGLEYDHSNMHHDSQLYYLPYPAEQLVPTACGLPKGPATNPKEVTEVPASSWMKPMSALKPSSIVEVPANWHLDDWPPMQLILQSSSTHGFVDPHVVEKLEAGEDGSFVFVMTIHPQVSGKPQVVLMHERLIEYINKHEGVEWHTCEEIVKDFKAGKLGGAKVQGGVDV